MDIKLLDNANEIRKAFMDRFVLSWDEFQSKHKDWIAQVTKESKGYITIDINWYENAFMWDRMDPGFPCASMEDALSFLKEHRGSVYFMSDKGEDTCYQGQELVDFVAEADAQILAERIEQEWYDFYRLAEQNMYDADAFLPDDLYVFDASMKWCIVFTHETTDWESELDNPMKAAQSRYCIICKA